jgi:thymidylate synthase
VPSNPGEQYKNWPWWRGQDEVTRIAGPTGKEPQFSHTYQERFWPKYAGEGDEGPYRTYEGRDNHGIRYRYGDLDDVVDLLRREPHTRQATFPIFFPEDTGAVHGGRVPCTLHYHFLVRNGRLHLWYPIRSCDAVRHFRDDLYMACRLAQWMLIQLRTEPEEQGVYDFWRDVEPGWLYFTAYSFHVHMGDIHLL